MAANGPRTERETCAYQNTWQRRCPDGPGPCPSWDQLNCAPSSGLESHMGSDSPCRQHRKRCLKGDLHQKRGKRGREATPGLVPAGPPPVSTTGRWSRAAPGEGAGLHSGQVARGASPFHAPLALSKLWPHRRPGLLRQQDADVHAPRGPDDSVRGLHAARGPENGIAPSRARSTPRGAWQVTSRPLLSERRHRTSRRGPPGAQHTGATRRTPHQPGEERGRSLMSPGVVGMTKTGGRGSTQEPQLPPKHDYPALRAAHRGRFHREEQVSN